MKKVIFLIVASALIVLTATVPARAQMGGGTGGGAMGDRQHEGTGSREMDNRQMMDRDMMRNMTGMMGQMNDMMQKMTNTMKDKTTMEHMKMGDMAKIMNEMSGQMREMADRMEKGNMDQATMNKMQERMKAMNQSIENLQKENK